MGFDLGLGEIAAAASLVGTGVSALGQINAAEAASANASYQAAVARNNQQIAAQNARYATAAGEEAATARSMAARAQQARLHAAAGAMGLDVNTGSPLDVQVSERQTNKLDTETALNNALLQAYGYKAQGSNFGAQAGLYDAQAQQAPTAGFLSAGGTLLSNASSLPFKFGWLSEGNSDLTLKPTGTYYGMVPENFIIPA